MACQMSWDMGVVARELNKSWITGAYRAHRRQIAKDLEMARLPEAMDKAEQIKQADALSVQAAQLRTQRLELTSRLRDMELEEAALEEAAGRLARGEVAKKETHTLKMCCSRPDCRGYLDRDYTCRLCTLTTCKACLTPLDEGHDCSEADLETAKTIRKSTKPCPECGERIQKSSGCDQMWCISCHTAFSWRTGRKETGVIHNPEFYRWKRERGIALERQPGDDPCDEGVRFERAHSRLIAARSRLSPHSAQLRRRCESPLAMIAVAWVEALLAAHQTVSHILHVELEHWRERERQCENTEDLRVDFILGKISEDDLGSAAEKKDRDLRKMRAILGGYELVAQAAPGVLISVCGRLDEEYDHWTDDIISDREFAVYCSDHAATACAELSELAGFANLAFCRSASESDATIPWLVQFPSTKLGDHVPTLQACYPSENVRSPPEGLKIRYVSGPRARKMMSPDLSSVDPAGFTCPRTMEEQLLHNGCRPR